MWNDGELKEQPNDKETITKTCQFSDFQLSISVDTWEKIEKLAQNAEKSDFRKTEFSFSIFHSLSVEVSCQASQGPFCTDCLAIL